jgi:glycosyltransferase involved in cell wall biosynthesis
VERTLSRWTDALLFQSSEDHDRARVAGYRGRLVQLGNGISDEWFESGRDMGRQDAFHAAFVGRLTREKGVGELLEVAARLRNVRWTIVGDALPSDRDSLADEVAHAANQSGGRIRWVGMVSPECVRHHLSTADLLVLPSWREGVPRSVIEGMATGLPVVATDIRGCRELVTPGVNGWLVPAMDVPALTSAVTEAAALPANQLAAMGAAGRARAWERHREQAVFERIDEVYRALGVTP